jgi:hypothetical protein
MPLPIQAIQRISLKRYTMKISNEPIMFISRRGSAKTIRPPWCSPCTGRAHLARRQTIGHWTSVPRYIRQRNDPRLRPGPFAEEAFFRMKARLNGLMNMSNHTCSMKRISLRPNPASDGCANQQGVDYACNL